MLQKMFQFSQILRYVDRNWYIGKEINANNMVNFSSQRMDTVSYTHLTLPTILRV